MRPIVSVVGKSDSGKTALLERLVPELKKRGYKVALIKHAGEGFDLDTPGKDSWRFAQAGSEGVVISSPGRVAMVRQAERDLEPRELSRLINWDYDLILTEGFKQASTPKIEVHRREQGAGLLCEPKQLMAVVTDEPLDVEVPQFLTDDVKGLAELIEQKLEGQLKGEHFEVSVNGSHISLNPFVRDIMSRTVAAMVSSLKGVENLKSLRIVLRRGG